MINSEYIERHSRQLILPNWSMALQEEISKIKVSIPQDKFLCMYLVALGISKLHFQDCDNFYNFCSTIPNWNHKNILFSEINEADYIIYLDRPNFNLKGRIGTVTGEIIDSKLHMNAFLTNRDNETTCNLGIRDVKYPKLENGIFLAIFFSNFLKSSSL